MDHTKYVVQYTKRLSVQFIATWQISVPKDVQYVDSTISNNEVIILSQTNCVYATFDGAKLSRSALRSKRSTIKKYNTLNLKRHVTVSSAC
jgi:hypothetical protein